MDIKMSHDSTKEQRLGFSDGLSDPDRWRNQLIAESRRIEINEKNDFGFSLEDEMQLPENSKAQRIYDLVKPLLTNLAKGETQDAIKWKGSERVKQMKKLINDIEYILGE